MGDASGLHPTLRRGAKDGAPELLGLVEGGPPGYRKGMRGFFRFDFAQGRK